MLVILSHAFDQTVKAVLDHTEHTGKVFLALHFPKSRKGHLGSDESPYPVLRGPSNLEAKFTWHKTQTDTEWIVLYGPFKPSENGEAYRVHWPTYGEHTGLALYSEALSVVYGSLQVTVPLV